MKYNPTSFVYARGNFLSALFLLLPHPSASIFSTFNLLYPLQKCCIRFAHIVGNILHTICTYATYYLMTICICAKYKKLTKYWAYAQNMRSTIYIYFGKICAEYKYAECMHFAYMHSTRMLHICIVHIIIMRFAHMLYICQLRICCIYVNCTYPSVLMTSSLIM